MTEDEQKLTQNSSNSYRDLPDHAVVKILLHLPIKSIFAFKSVSKRWNSLISAQQFSQSYVAKQKLRYSTSSLPWTLLRYRADDKTLHDDHYTIDRLLSSNSINDQVTFSVCDISFPKRSVDQYYHEQYEVVSSSSNGLLLFRAKHDTLYAICNPVTRQCVLVPYHNKSQVENVYEAFVTEVDESGLKLISYKVIRFYHRYQNEHVDMEIYNSDTKTWTKSIRVTKPRFSMCKDAKPFCFNGKIHWKGSGKDGVCMLAYNPYGDITNCFRSIRLPQTREHIVDTRTPVSSLVGVHDGNLQYLEIRTLDADAQALIIWELEHYRIGRWRLKQHIPLKRANSRILTSGFDSYKPLAFHPFDSNIIYLITVQEPSRVISYDVKKRLLTILRNVSSNSRSPVQDSSQVFPFVLPLWPPIIDC